jgi:hypothetical protein
LRLARFCGISALLVASTSAQSLFARDISSAVVTTSRINGGRPNAKTSLSALTGRTDTALATLRGVVNDSLHLIPLADAHIRAVRRDTVVNKMLQTVWTATTDQSGQFRIDGLLPGVYSVEVTHPILDSLALHLIAQSVELHAGVVSSVLLQVPSAAQLTKQVCGETPSLDAPRTLLIGRVMDAEADTGLTSARVQLSWHTIEVSATGVPAIRTVPHNDDVVSGHKGVYAICDLPDSLSGHVQATYHGSTTPSMPIAFGAETVSVYQLSLDVRGTGLPTQHDSATASTELPMRPTSRASVAKRAVLNGRVIDSHGDPVIGASAQLSGSRDATPTDATGSFTLYHTRSGTQLLFVRKFGFAPIQVPVTLSTRAPSDVTVTMDSAATVLTPVEIRALERPGAFERRRRTGQGYYIDSAAIQRRHATDFTELIENIPRLSLGGPPGVGAGASSINTNTCPLSVRFLVDGIVVHADNVGEINSILSVADVAAIEVYGIATVPPEFAMFMEPCSNIVVVWTRGSRSH